MCLWEDTREQVSLQLVTRLHASVHDAKARHGMFVVGGWWGRSKEPGLPSICVRLMSVPPHLEQWHIKGAVIHVS